MFNGDLFDDKKSNFELAYKRDSTNNFQPLSSVSQYYIIKQSYEIE